MSLLSFDNPPEVVPERTTDTYDLYQKRVKSLNEIRRTIGSTVDLRLPKIVVGGDQSSGKSSLLERVTGVHFPTKSGICTKAAIVVECHRDENKAESVFQVFDPESGAWQEVAGGKPLADKILAIQNQMLVESGKKVCTKEILVRVTGPEQIDIIVIDLPGIIHTGEGKAETRQLINK